MAEFNGKNFRKLKDEVSPYLESSALSMCSFIEVSVSVWSLRH